MEKQKVQVKYQGTKFEFACLILIDILLTFFITKAIINMLRKLLHIILLATLVITPVVNGYSAALMADVANMPVSEETVFSSALFLHHSHGGSSIENIKNADLDEQNEQTHTHKNMTSSHSQDCCLDCDGECVPGCLLVLGIIPPPALFLKHTLDTAVSFLLYPRFQTPSDLPKRPPRLS